MQEILNEENQEKWTKNITKDGSYVSIWFSVILHSQITSHPQLFTDYEPPLKDLLRGAD